MFVRSIYGPIYWNFVFVQNDKNLLRFLFIEVLLGSDLLLYNHTNTNNGNG